MKKIKYAVTILMWTMMITPVLAQDPVVMLSKIDSVQNAFSDMSATEQMQLIDDNGQGKERAVDIRQKGKELRMVRFLEPADVRGVGFLRLASDRLYIYLPAFRKVRRIASSATDENFMGTDFTYEDMSQSTYSDDYNPQDLTTRNGQYRLTLIPKAGADVNYGKLVLVADTPTFVLRKVEYFDRRGEKTKELTVDDVEKIDGYWMGKTMVMQSLEKKHRTILKLSDIRFDRGLSDNAFSERSLKRPIR